MQLFFGDDLFVNNDDKQRFHQETNSRVFVTGNMHKYFDRVLPWASKQFHTRSSITMQILMQFRISRPRIKIYNVCPVYTFPVLFCIT